MIKLLLLALLLVSCESVTTTGYEAGDTLYIRDTITDTIVMIQYEVIRDTVMVEYDYYISDTLMFITDDLGRFLVINQYDRDDTVLDYTKYEQGNDTIKFSCPRQMFMIYYDQDLRWKNVNFSKGVQYISDGYFYHISDGFSSVLKF